MGYFRRRAELRYLASEHLVRGELDAGFLHFAVREEPDERFVVQIDDLDAVAPRVAKVAAETFEQLQAVFVRNLGVACSPN